MTLCVDRNERSTAYAYDAVGRKANESWYAAGVDPAAPGATPSQTYAYDYDAVGRLESVVDSAGPNYAYLYDAVGRLEETTISAMITRAVWICTPGIWRSRSIRRSKGR